MKKLLIVLGMLLAVSAQAALFTDGFNRANGVLGSPWTLGDTADMQIVSNEAKWTNTVSPAVIGVDLSAYASQITSQFVASYQSRMRFGL